MGKVSPNHWSNDQRTLRTNLVRSEDKTTWYTWFMRTQTCVQVVTYIIINFMFSSYISENYFVLVIWRDLIGWNVSSLCHYTVLFLLYGKGSLDNFLDRNKVKFLFCLRFCHWQWSALYNLWKYHVQLLCTVVHLSMQFCIPA